MKDEFKGLINSEVVAIDVAAIIYNQGKGRILNVLESQIEDPRRLGACKRITEDILKDIARQTASYIKNVLGDWEEEITAGGILEDDELIAAEQEYKQLEQIIK